MGENETMYKGMRRWVGGQEGVAVLWVGGGCGDMTMNLLI